MRNLFSVRDLGGFNAHVNALCPGLLETGMAVRVFDHAQEMQKEPELGLRCELRRYDHLHESAAAIAFLASDDASHIAGQVISVDSDNTALLNLPGMKAWHFSEHVNPFWIPA